MGSAFSDLSWGRISEGGSRFESTHNHQDRPGPKAPIKIKSRGEINKIGANGLFMQFKSTRVSQNAFILNIH